MKLILISEFIVHMENLQRILGDKVVLSLAPGDRYHCTHLYYAAPRYDDDLLKRVELAINYLDNVNCKLVIVTDYKTIKQKDGEDGQNTRTRKTTIS